MDFHKVNDYEEKDTDNTDFDYITVIFGSFTDKKNMQLYEEEEIFQNSNLGEFYQDASFRACQKHQTMPSKFNYKLIIKTLVSQKFSYG